MNKIESFVNKIFEDAVMNQDLEAQKEELILNMTDRFNEMIEEGVNEQKAYRDVISNFGSIEEIKGELNICENTVSTHKSKNKKSLITSILIISIIIIFLISVSNYHHNRKYNMSNDLTHISFEINRIVMAAKGSNKSVDLYYDINENMQSLQDLHNILYRDLNFFEKINYEKTSNQFFLSYKISDLYKKLVVRNRMGYWNPLDDEVYSKFVSLTEELLWLLETEDSRISGRNENGDKLSFTDLRIVLANLDVKKISDKYRELNELANCYVMYGKLPEDINLLSESEVINLLKEKFDDENINVEFPSYGMDNAKAVDGIYEHIELKGEGYRLLISVDAHTGQLYYSHGHNYEDSDNSFIVAKEDDVEGAQAILHRLFDKEANYKIKYKGLNYNMESDIDYCSYEIIPQYFGYEIYYRYVKPIIYLKKNNIKEIDLYHNIIMPLSIAEIGEREINYNEEEALEYVVQTQMDYLEKLYGTTVGESQFQYIKTAYIKSFATGKYDLVHIYNLVNTSDYNEKDSQLMIHTSNGRIEN